MPEIKSVLAFEDLWVQWWSAAQPIWRDTNSWPFSQDETVMDDWGMLSLGGKDGLFVVMMTLGWWIHARDPAVDSKVGDAISDVSWVVKHIISSLAADATTHSPPSNPPATSSQRRRSPSLGPPAASSQQSQGAASLKIGPPRKRARMR